MEEQNNQPAPEQAEAPKMGLLPKIGVELSKVATNPKQSIAIIAILALVSIYFAYSFIKGSMEDENKTKVQVVERPKVVVKPTPDMDVAASGTALPSLPKTNALKDPSVASQPVKVSNAPKLPDAPKASSLAKPPRVSMKDVFSQTQPSSPPLVSQAPLVPVVQPQPTASLQNADSLSLALPKAPEDPETQKKLEQRKKSTIMLISGTQKKTQAQIDQDTAFKRRSNLDYLLPKGKTIEAVIETSINSDFAGEVRAIVSRDVYSEGGKTILIPKGSKVFGAFTSSVDSVYGRVDIKWDRIDLPIGYTLTFAGTGIDNLGRKGSEGRLDNRVKEKISASLLSTVLNVTFANISDKLVPPVQSTQSTAQTTAQLTAVQTAASTAASQPGATGISVCTAAQSAAATDPTSAIFAQLNTLCSTAATSTAAAMVGAINASANAGVTANAVASTPSMAQEAVKQGMTDFTSTLTDVMKQVTPKPTVTIDQGTNVIIYVNKDYNFPKAAVNGSKVLQ